MKFMPLKTLRFVIHPLSLHFSVFRLCLAVITNNNVFSASICFKEHVNRSWKSLTVISPAFTQRTTSAIQDNCHHFYVSLCIQFIVTSSGLITCKNTTISSKYLFIYTQAQTAALYFKSHIKVKPC